MIPAGLLAIPLMTAAAFFGVSLVADVHTIDFNSFTVPKSWEEVGYSESVVTRRLSDDLREITERAASIRGNRYGEDTGKGKSIETLGEYFEIIKPMRALQQALGLIPFTIGGEVVERASHHELLVRVSSHEGRTLTLTSHTESNDIDALIHEAALDIMTAIDPYMMVAYYYYKELPSKKFVKTYELLGRCLADCPAEDLPWAYNVWGRILIHQQQHADAIEKLTKALALRPDFARPYINWAIALADQGQYEGAFEKFHEAMRREPGYAPIYVEWAVVLGAMNRPDDANLMFRNAITVEPGNVRAYERWANYLVSLGRKQEALDLYRKASELLPLDERYTARIVQLLTDLEPSFHLLAPKPAGL